MENLIWNSGRDPSWNQFMLQKLIDRMDVLFVIMVLFFGLGATPSSAQ